MSTTTTNLSLVKPELTDPADITAMNPNWDKIDSEIPNRVHKNGDSMTGALTFTNYDSYSALAKNRRINGIRHYINWGLGVIGGVGCNTLEVFEGEIGADVKTARLEVSKFGVAFIDQDGKRTYLYRSSVVAASVES